MKEKILKLLEFTKMPNYLSTKPRWRKYGNPKFLKLIKFFLGGKLYYQKGNIRIGTRDCYFLELFIKK